MSLLVFALTIGIVYALLALAVIFSFRILGFPDLTPDGSFLIGAALGGIVLIKKMNLRIKENNIVGLAISNGIAGLSGGIISQYQGFVDVSMGTGLVIVCLAAIIIGEIILRPRTVLALLLCSVIGMVIYQGIISIALRLGLPSTDMKIATVVLTILFISIERVRNSTSAIDRQIGNKNI